MRRSCRAAAKVLHPRGSLPAMSDTTIVITIILVIITIVTITEFFLLAAYIVYKTGATTGIADIGRAVAAIIAAIRNETRRPSGPSRF